MIVGIVAFVLVAWGVMSRHSASARLGEGGEQNAPLGRAVIGGLVLATVSTLLFVPTVFSVLHGRRLRKTAGLQGATT
jgi:multidrug efflux pump subunit AcrB